MTTPGAGGGNNTTADGAGVPAVGETTYDVVYAEGPLELRRYEPETRSHQTPVLVVYALVNRPYVLDLEPDRSVVRQLLAAGFPVYLVDWGSPSRLDGSLGLVDYAGRYLDNCRAEARADANAPDCHVLGYCMGGTLAAINAALDDSGVRTLTTVAAPIHFDDTAGLLEHWATHLDPAPVVDRYGLVPGELLAWTFALLDPIENTIGKLVRLAERSGDSAAVATFLRLERWIWDGVDVSGAVFRQFVTNLYRENELTRGQLLLGGQSVTLGNISVPHQHLVGARDDLVPPASTRPLAGAIEHSDGRVVECPVGHVGLSVSRRAHDDLWPDATSWLAARSEPLLSPSPGNR